MRTSPSGKKKIVITAGDPAGIGPEVTLKALASPKVKGLADFFVVGDKSVMRKAERDFGVRLKFDLLDPGGLKGARYRYGECSGRCGAAAVKYLDTAVSLIRLGRADAVVTAPVNKASIRMAGYRDFEGHTEYLAGVTGSKDVAMMFVAARMKITLVTGHIPLKEVPFRISTASIYSAIAITHKHLKKYFGLSSPRIGVAGINPHAGERGLFGSEEDRIIKPAVRKASAAMAHVTGPYPPDIVFHDLYAGKHDAVISIYHDQALIPFKLLYFSDGVNLTLGLPFVRTSPDHGTAFDIAGNGVADPSSMIEAIRLACRLCKV